jgi:hypothetical protein
VNETMGLGDATANALALEMAGLGLVGPGMSYLHAHVFWRYL